MKSKLSDLWRWDGTVDRGTYCFWGVVLFAVKFNVDRLLLDQPWSIFSRNIIRLYLWQSIPEATDQFRYLLLLGASLPFVWAGVVLTFRRLRSIGWKPWWVMLFFVPVLKLFFFMLLCLIPSRDPARAEKIEAEPGRFADRIGVLIPRSGLGSAVLALLISALSALAAAWLGTMVLRDYGWSIFVGLPFCMGLLAVLIYGFHEQRTLRACLVVANGPVLLAGAGLLLLAMEGVICILMAAPIALALASIGGVVGHAIQKRFRWSDESPRLLCVAVLAMPAVMAIEHVAPPALPLLEVKTSVIVSASPAEVWRNVVSFSELPPPQEVIFTLGVAYPMRAEIRGQGAGALRHCVFSTGPFVEPIEVWDEPRRLQFSVTKNPPPMQEWTPYRHVHPPHLDGYLESRAGQFRLVPLKSGGTLLEGTTWYHHHMWPAAYWQLWSDQIIHTIHRRVLNHVKALSERAEQSSVSAGAASR